MSTEQLERIERLERVSDRHEQTLHGPTGDNGVYGDVRELKAWRAQLQLRLAMVVGLAAGAGGGLGTLLQSLIS